MRQEPVRDRRDGLGSLRVRALPRDATRPVLDEPQKKGTVASGERAQVALYEPQDAGPRQPVRYVEQGRAGCRRFQPGGRGHARDP